MTSAVQKITLPYPSRSEVGNGAFGAPMPEQCSHRTEVPV